MNLLNSQITCGTSAVMSGKGGPELKKFMDKKVLRKALQLYHSAEFRYV